MNSDPRPNAGSDPSVVSAHHLRKVVNGPSGRLTILEDVSLHVKEGEAVAILGASGSGKSTLLGLLAGLDTSSDGEAFLFNRALTTLDEDARARLRAGCVGFVFQSFQLLPGMTALENVMLPLELTANRAAEKRARESLNQVGLGERLAHYPSQLSGGEQQRVAIARAFAPEPRLLFADEPTGNLDQASGRMIAKLLFDLQKQTGTALVLVTHDEVVASGCDRRMLLENGELKEQR